MIEVQPITDLQEADLVAADDEHNTNSLSHLREPPSEEFWRKELFLNELDNVLKRVATPDGLQAEVKANYRTEEARNLIQQIVERSGGEDNARKTLVLVAAFT